MRAKDSLFESSYSSLNAKSDGMAIRPSKRYAGILGSGAELLEELIGLSVFLSFTIRQAEIDGMCQAGAYLARFSFEIFLHSFRRSSRFLGLCILPGPESS